MSIELPSVARGEQGTRSYDVLLFDLGGVIVDFTGPVELAQWVDLPAAEIKRRWVEDPSVRTFESGGCDADTFAASFVAAWDLPLTPDAFLEVFAGWARALLPGAADVLAELRPHYRLACLSNSNPVHWRRKFSVLGIGQLFDVQLASHELGLVKPDPAIYVQAVQRLDVEPGRIAFFDDLPANIAAARAAGMVAEQVEGVASLRAALRRLGCIGE